MCVRGDKIIRHCLLRCALDALSLWVTILVVLVHALAAAKRPGSGVGVWVLQVGWLGHGLSRWDVLDRWRRKDLAELFEGRFIGGPSLLGELYVELDVKISVVVVAVRWHTLATEHLDSICNMINKLLAV